MKKEFIILSVILVFFLILATGCPPQDPPAPQPVTALSDDFEDGPNSSFYLAKGILDDGDTLVITDNNTVVDIDGHNALYIHAITQQPQDNSRGVEIQFDLVDSGGSPQFHDLSGQDFVKDATTERIYTEGNGKKHVVLIDYGAKGNIIKSLVERECKVTVAPCDISATEVLKLKPDGIMLSNGPGDPRDIPYAVRTVQELIGKLPIFGICLGHQLVGLALGGEIYKLKFGHRGGNHPVKN